MENKEKLENALGEYVLLYNRVIHFFEQEIKDVLTANFYSKNCIIDNIVQLAFYESESGMKFFNQHSNLPNESPYPLHGQGVVFKFYNSENQKRKELKIAFDCLYEKWLIRNDVDSQYYHDDIFETSYLDVLHKISTMLKKQYNTAGIQYNQKVTELETLFNKIFEHHQTIIKLNK